MINLFPHQRKVLETTKDMNRVAYYLDMGLGKTFVGSEKMVQLDLSINLLVCQKSKIEDWINHFNEFYSYPGSLERGCNPYHVIDLTKWKAADFKNEDKFITNLIAGQIIYVINYELAFRRPELKRLKNFTLMLDESSLIQNETSKRSKFILSLNPENVILLSGTPIDGKYERLWSQLNLLGWQIPKDLYMKQYVEREWIEDDSGFKIPIITGYKNVDRLKKKLADHGAVFMKSEEAFTLPQQVHIPVMLSTSKNYRVFMKKDIVTVRTLDSFGMESGSERELIGDAVFSKRMYARMLCGQYSVEKVEAFRDLIFSTNDRLIVFYNFTEEVDLLQEVAKLKTEHISVVNGKGKNLQAYEEQEDSITFIQYQAGAMGLNLQRANRIVYYTLPEKSEYFEQSKKRIHRIGQEKTCFYHYLICRNSVETDIWENLKMRKDYTDALFEQYEVKG